MWTGLFEREHFSSSYEGNVAVSVGLWLNFQEHQLLRSHFFSDCGTNFKPLAF